MDVKVTIKEVRVIERTYFVNGVNSLENAAKCAERCATHQYQPNTYLYREVPRRPTYQIDKYEVVNSD
jgi:hypothetical protein